MGGGGGGWDGMGWGVGPSSMQPTDGRGGTASAVLLLSSVGLKGNSPAPIHDPHALPTRSSWGSSVHVFPPACSVIDSMAGSVVVSVVVCVLLCCCSSAVGDRVVLEGDVHPQLPLGWQKVEIADNRHKVRSAYICRHENTSFSTYAA